MPETKKEKTAEPTKEEKALDSLIARYEKLDPLTSRIILKDKASTLIPALSAILEEEGSGLRFFALFILVTIAADGKLTEGEYSALLPSLKAFFGEKDAPSYEDCLENLKLLKTEEKEAKKELDDFVDQVGAFSPAMKEDLVVVALLICAVDGQVSAREKAWIRRLIED